METLFKPDPELVFFIFYKKYLYLEAICALSILRLYAHRARLDVLALFSLLLSFIGLIFLFGLSFLGIYDGPLAEFARSLSKWQNGAAMLIMASLPLLLSSLRSYTRWAWIDFFHGILVGVLVVLYWITTTL